MNDVSDELTVAVAFLGAAAFFSVLGSAFLAVVVAAAGFASFFASFTVPEAPDMTLEMFAMIRAPVGRRVDIAC